MRFGLLGPLEVRTDEKVLRLGGDKQRALLAILLVHANEVVLRDRLLEEIWPDRPPGGAAHSLDHQISRLRKVLDPPDALVTRSGGYVLRVLPGDIDVHHFEENLERGRQANAAGKPTEALAALDAALDLWRGPALAGVVDEPFLAVEAQRLEELRLTALEERFDARLGLGEHHSLVAELDAFVKHHPLRERPRAQLMLALYRSGRQAEALRVYADARRALVDELGLEPGPELQQLERAILRQDPSLAAARRARLGRRGRVAALLAVPLAAALVAGVVVLAGRTGGSRADNSRSFDAVAFVSARTGKLVGHTDEVNAPLQSTFFDGALWNLSGTGILSKIDPQTGKVVARANTAAVPCGLAAGEGALWVSDCSSPTVVQVDPAHDIVVGRARLPVPFAPLADATQSVVVGAGSVWVGQGTDNPSYVWRLDPESGRVRHRYVIPAGGAEALAFGDGALWVGGGVIGRLSRIDPVTNEVTSPARDLGEWLCCVAAGGGYVWAAINPGGTVWKLSEHGDVVSSVKLGASVAELDYAEGALWAADGEGGRLVRIDPATDAARPYRLGHSVMGTAVHGGVLALSLQPAGKDVTAGIHGRVAVVALPVDQLDATSTDPLGTQFAFNPVQVQFHYATCAKLFNYPDNEGPDGQELAPEVAAGFPTVTDAGRTYTFRIHSGFGFSPPSHEQVTAASFRHALERYLSPAGGNYDPLVVLGDIVGAEAYSAGTAPHVSGISVRGDTLVIRLLHRAGDLPARLSLPAFCAVPVDLPTVPHGLPYPIPSAGPYYLADRSSDVFVLKPNPNYHGQRPRRLDAIVYRVGIEPGVAAAGIARGTIDYIAAQDLALAPHTASARAAGARYRLTANNWTERLALNTSRPLFSDATTRRAVALALDRPQLAYALGGADFQLPTSTLLPPNLRDSARPSYSLRPDLRAARRLMRGRHFRAVFAADADDAGNPFDSQLGQVLRTQLGRIGITLTIVPLPQTLDPAQRSAVLATADLARTGGNADDARDPVQYLLHLPYLTAPDRRQLVGIHALPSEQRARAAAAVAARLEREAAYIGYSDRATPELVSARLGCTIDQPEYPGIDLAALCIRHR
jgi:DNA-binding SARP family transcriptional activator/ABC-type transport system substrate-binding protein/streptogramin lyase